jgi:hypothetical protein
MWSKLIGKRCQPSGSVFNFFIITLPNVIMELKKSVHAKFGGLEDNNEGGVERE